MWLLLALLAPAQAAPECDPVDEEAFRTLFLDALAALDRDDAALHAQIVAEVRESLPCLTFAPPPRLWADFLVGVAVVEFAQGGDWETPMSAALRIRPSVDRLVSGAHPLNRWEPPAETPPPGPALPEDARVWVDGTLATNLPPGQGLYLIQKEDDGWFETRLVENEVVTLDWATSPVERPPRTEMWLYASGGLGLGVVGQIAFYETNGSVDEPPDFSDYLPTDAWVGLMPRASADGLASYGRLGVLGHMEIGWGNAARASLGNVRGGPVLLAGPLVAGIGLGLQSFEVWEGGCHITHATPGEPNPARPPESLEQCHTVATPRTVGLPYGTGVLWLRGRKPWSPQPQAALGMGPYMARFDFGLHVEPPPTRRGAQWRHGLLLNAAIANFERTDRLYNMVVNPGHFYLGLQSGLVFGQVR